MIITIVFIVLFVLMLCESFFALGRKISSDKHMKEKFELLDYSDLIFCIILSGILLAINIWGYRVEGMDGLKRGKYGYEEVVRTKTKGNVVKVDTTYNFYRIKPEKK